MAPHDELVVMSFYCISWCPNCHNPVHVDFGSNSGLGPAFIQCSHCDEAFETDRSEWTDKTLAGKVWYIVISHIYVIFGAFFGAISLRGAFHLWQNPGKESFPPMGPGIVPGIIFGALLVLCVQISRIAASIKRAKNEDLILYRPSFLNFQIFLMPKVLGIMFCIPLVTWLIRIGLGKLGYIS